MRWYSRPASISLRPDGPMSPETRSTGSAKGRQFTGIPAFHATMTRILDRYLLREAVGASFAVTTVLMVVIVCYRFARVLGEAAAGELPRDAVLTLLGLTSISYLLLVAPFGLFLGVMLGL